MELRHLRYFVAVAEELNFHRAAARLHMSQPPLSQQIHALEHELNVELLSRTNRRVELTEAGRLFLTRARAILRYADHAKLEMHNVASGEGGNFRIGYMSAAMLSNLPVILESFRRSLSSVAVTFSQYSVGMQLQAIADGELDIGFVDLTGRQSAISIRDRTLQLERVWNEEMVVMLPRNHPLSSAAVLSIDAVLEQPLISLAKSPFLGFFDRVAQLCERSGQELRINQVVDSFPEIVSLVAAGYGISFAPSSSASPWHSDVRFVRLEGRPLVDVSVVWSESNTSPLLARFRGCISEITRKGWPLRAEEGLSPPTASRKARRPPPGSRKRDALGAV